MLYTYVILDAYTGEAIGHCAVFNRSTIAVVGTMGRTFYQSIAEVKRSTWKFKQLSPSPFEYPDPYDLV